MAKRDPIPTITQAKLLARVWSGGGRTSTLIKAPDGSEPYVEPTMKVCLRHGWFRPFGEPDERMDSGYISRPITITTRGLYALEEFLCVTRQKAAI